MRKLAYPLLTNTVIDIPRKIGKVADFPCLKSVLIIFLIDSVHNITYICTQIRGGLALSKHPPILSFVLLLSETGFCPVAQVTFKLTNCCLSFPGAKIIGVY